jgi:hypothetical protein
MILPHAARPRRPGFVPAVEALEARVVPTTAVLSRGVLRLAGTPGADRVVVRQSAGRIRIDGLARTFAVAQVARLDIQTGGGNDRVLLSPSVTVSALIAAGSGNDFVQGGRGPDTILGGLGNDTLVGGVGNDVVIGGPGRNTIMGGRQVNVAGGIVYVPDSLVRGRRPALVVAFSPNGQPQSALSYLTQQADRSGCLVYASSEYRNGSGDLDYDTPGKHIKQVVAAFGVDPTRVIFTGVSGGGSFAHAMNFAFPGLGGALIINTAMIWGPTVPGPNDPQPGTNGPDWYDEVNDHLADYKAQFAASGSRRLIVFLGSPGDFRYEEMQRDVALYRRLGWTVFYTEFSGGHRLAPASKYAAAFDWIFSR